MENFVEELRKYLESLTPEQLEEERQKFFPEDTKPKGWLSIEEHLPMFMANDIMQGYSIYKVRDKDGNEFESGVADHNTWYYEAKDAGITHWLNT
jgi:hypothetical protein